MKIANQWRLPAMVVALPLLLVACKKESIQTNYPSPDLENVRMTGAVEDDPGLVEKIPMIVSAEFLATNKNFDRSVVPSRGKKDLAAPSVSITSPGNNATVSGSVAVQVTASDNVGISTISLSVDGVIINTLFKSPASFTWNSAAVSNGTHTLAATATDAAGNGSATSIQVWVNNVAVGDITKPAVNITSPTNGSSISGTVNIAAAASDNVGVSLVTFSVDGSTIGSDNNAPYSIAWNTSNYTTGVHTITATATDAAGNFNASSVQVTINTAVINPPPSLPGSYQLVMPPVSHQGSEGSCVSFAVGYAARSCEQHYKTNASTYSYSSNIFSPEFLFNLTTLDANCSSSTLISALNTLKYVGICTWQSMPYSSSNGCSAMPTTSQNNEAANFKITSYSALYTSDLTAIKSMIAAKHPIMLTFATDASFYSAGPGFIWKSYSSNPGAGHAVTICGYDDSKHAVKIMNSWGTSWGDAGYCWIDYDFLPTLNANVYVMNL